MKFKFQALEFLFQNGEFVLKLQVFVFQLFEGFSENRLFSRPFCE